MVKEVLQRATFTCEANFDMTQRQSLVSESIEGLFGLTKFITAPGPVGLTDGNKQDLPCLGTVTFCIKIAEKMTIVTAWVTDAIREGTLVIGAGTM